MGRIERVSACLGFTVQELQDGVSSLAFSCRIVAPRKDVTAPRLAAVSLNLPPADAPELPAQPVPIVPPPVAPPIPPPAVVPPLPTVPATSAQGS
jgi:hypothetical protein